MPTRMQPPCWYEVLGVSRDASAEDIKAAFHQVALRLHPDKALSNSSGNGGSAAIAADDSYLSVQQAWEVGGFRSSCAALLLPFAGAKQQLGAGQSGRPVLSSAHLVDTFPILLTPLCTSPAGAAGCGAPCRI